MSIWLVLSLIISLATACERSDGVMSCDRLPDHLDGMEGIRILVVKRTLRISFDLPQFPLEKVQFHSTEMTCDNIKTQPATQVFLREKLCSSPAYIHESTSLTTNLTTMTETAVVSFLVFVLLKYCLLRLEPMPQTTHQPPRDPVRAPIPPAPLRRSRRNRKSPTETLLLKLVL
uniref:Uncharacterized protein LOC111113603 n=1 Tax=Crassostrea virginica TaxID=6565 RepID=A0A8B8BWD8_CRAVI|nr:uncharacterized protein LOC111113603 [Crassostrea virginica]